MAPTPSQAALALPLHRLSMEAGSEKAIILPVYSSNVWASASNFLPFSRSTVNTQQNEHIILPVSSSAPAVAVPKNNEDIAQNVLPITALPLP